jgi:hypothetical protein
LILLVFVFFCTTSSVLELSESELDDKELDDKELDDELEFKEENDD